MLGLTVCFMVIALAVCLWRNGGVRGWVRAEGFIHLGVEIGRNLPPGPSPIDRTRSRFRVGEPAEDLPVAARAPAPVEPQPAHSSGHLIERGIMRYDMTIEDGCFDDTDRDLALDWAFLWWGLHPDDKKVMDEHFLAETARRQGERNRHAEDALCRLRAVRLGL